VYSEDGKRLLFHMKLNEGSKLNLEETNFFKGVCSFSSGDRDFIAVGNSKGEVKIIENVKENQFVQTETIGSKDIPISQVVSVNSDNLLITGDIQGGICVYSAAEPKACKLLKELDIYSKKSPINSMVSMDMKSVSSIYKNNYLCCGDFLGKLKIFNLTNFNLLAEISSHSRMVTTLDVKLNTFEIVSGSDDTFLNFWKLEEEGDGELKVSLKVSFRIADQMIVGAQYLRGRDECMISIYDSQEITVLKYEK
jgi:WD40 repeat protein